MPDSPSSQSRPQPLNDLDLSNIDPSLLEPVNTSRDARQGSTIGLLLVMLGATIVVSLDASQRWLVFQVGSVGSVLIPLALGFGTASIAWRLLEKRARASAGKPRSSLGEKLVHVSKLEPWVAVIGLGGALVLKITNIAKGYEVGIGLLGILGGIAGALWLSRQIERRVDP